MPYYLPIVRRRDGFMVRVKCKYHPVFELGSPIPFCAMISIMLSVPYVDIIVSLSDAFCISQENRYF